MSEYNRIRQVYSSREYKTMTSKENTYKEDVVDRELLAHIVNSTPKVTIEQVTPDGEVAFCVQLKDIKLTQERILSSKIGSTRFFSNFVGEFLVRSNMNVFAGILLGLDSKTYDVLVTAYEHQNFGMFISKELIKIEFHISLIENILNEDIFRTLP